MAEVSEADKKKEDPKNKGLEVPATQRAKDFVSTRAIIFIQATTQAFAEGGGQAGQGAGGENLEGGAKGGKEDGVNKDWSKIEFYICGVLHLAKL